MAVAARPRPSPRRALARSLVCAAVLLATACTRAAPTPTTTPTPTPVVVASPGTGGTCGDPVPAGFTCVTGQVQAQSGAPVVGVCVTVGPVATCSFSSDSAGRWKVELPSGVHFVLTFRVDGRERARAELTPSFLSGGTKEWPTPVSID